MKMELFQKNVNADHWRTLQAICACSQICNWLLLFAPNVKGEWVDSNFQITDLLVQPGAAGVAGTLIFVHIANQHVQLGCM